MENIPLVSFKEEMESLKKDFLKAFDEQLDKGEFIGGISVQILKVILVNTYLLNPQ